MAKYIIEGGRKLSGSVRLSGSKNSSFPCIAAALLTKEDVVLKNVPKIRDVAVTLEILQTLGASVSFEENTLTINASEVQSFELKEELTTKLRGSVVFAGALLSRFGKVSFHHPGGDVIGKRAINLHLEGYEKLGFKVEQNNKLYKVFGNRNEGENISIYFEIPTVTGTENLILASVLRDGQTVLKNCAQEPHIVDLCQMLNKMGASIEGVSSSKLVISGVKKLSGCEYTLRSDDLEFGTYAIAASLTGGKIEIENVRGFDVDPITYTLSKMGIVFEKRGDKYLVYVKKLISHPNAIANPWPGFPTDLMSVLIVLATQSQGVSLMHDWIYESRMYFVDKLINMGAHITIADPHRVVVYGPTPLFGRELETPDIRAGMAMVLAALVAKGTSVINKAELIERGYEGVIEKLQSIGAKIKRIE